MKHMYLNLKRFDISKKDGGVNDISPMHLYAKTIIHGIEKEIEQYQDLTFSFFFPEGHLLQAAASAHMIHIGCQGVYRKDVEIGGNFGAFTTFLPARAAKELGATETLIGHSEERNDLFEILTMGRCTTYAPIHTVLNQEIICAQKAGLKVLYCIGEKSDEQPNRFHVLKEQLLEGLEDADASKVVVAYEPIWAIGPGKPVPSKQYIREIVLFIKSIVDIPVVYGGGLKLDNAAMLAAIPELDGGLIALTSFGADYGFSLDGFLNIVKAYHEGLKTGEEERQQ